MWVLNYVRGVYEYTYDLYEVDENDLSFFMVKHKFCHCCFCEKIFHILPRTPM